MSRKRRGKIPAYQQEVTNIPQIVKPKTRNQNTLVQTINKNLITFAIGEAGTGKTHIAVGCAIEHVYNNWVEKIVITRPIVDVGSSQSLGFLPGTFEEKISPYLVPIYDEMKKFWPESSSYKLPMEIVPLNYMRGRTFEKAFIILDEAQNCSEEELKMFLTRFGQGSKMVITGDITQCDIRNGGLEKYLNRLEGEDLIGIVKLDSTDIVRHEIINRILNKLK